MRGKTLILLAVTAVAAIIATMLLERSSAPDSTVVDGGLLYPNLKSQLNGIARLEVSGAGAGDPIVLERSDSGWAVLQKAGYAADAGKIRQLLLRLAEASIVEAKTANPDLYARLAVADPDAPEGAGTLLAIGPPADIRVVIGERDARAGGTYVRRAGEAQSYLVDADIEANRGALDWVDREIMDIDSSAIRELRITHADGEVLQLLRVGDQLVVAGIPRDRELSGPGAAQPMARFLSPMRLDDVLPVGEFDQSNPEAAVDVFLDDGRRITARAWNRDEERWIAFDISLDPATEPETVPAVEAPEDQPDGENTAVGTDEPDGDGITGSESAVERADPETVAREDAELAGWVFRVPVYKYDQAVRRMDDLLKPVGD
jgi:hypothetical protein